MPDQSSYFGRVIVHNGLREWSLAFENVFIKNMNVGCLPAHAGQIVHDSRRL